MMRVTITCIAASVIAVVAANAMAAEPTMTSIGALPGDDALGPAAGDQTAPVIARGDDMSLVVWIDSASLWAGTQSENDVVAVRLDASGALIDQTPFVISREAGFQRSPRVAWNGESWLVAWENQTPTQFFYQSEVVAVRVSTAGQVLDADPIRPFGSDEGNMLALTANGGDWLLVTQSYSAGDGGIRARRIAADGTMPDAAPALLVDATYFLYFDIDIDAAGGDYLLTYKAGSDWVGRRFTAALTPIGGAIALPPMYRLASSGAGYYLVFAGGTFNNLILGSPMRPDGTIVFPSGVQLGDAYESSWLETDVAFDGTLWWVSRRDAWLGLTFQRVTDGNALLDPVGISIDTAHENDQASHHVAGRPAGGVTTVWQDIRAGGLRPYDVYSADVVDPSTFDAGAAISRAAPMQLETDIAEGSGQFLLAYTSRVSGSSRVLAHRLDAEGVPMASQPFIIDDDPAASNPAAAWNGTHYLVTWNRDGTVLARRLGPDGMFVDPAPVVVMTGGAPDVAALGSNFLVAVTDTFNFPHYRATYVRRMDGATGQPIDTDRFIVSYGNFAQLARVVTFAGRWLVTWQDNFSHDDPQSAVYARLVDADGGQSEQFTAIYSTGGAPDIAVSEDVAMFVWRNNSLSNANNSIAGRRMLPDGAFVDPAPFVVSEMPGRQLRPVVTWDGTRFAAAWEDQRGQSSFFDARTDVFGARLSPTGDPVIDPDGYAVFEEGAVSVRPAIASLGGDVCIATASVFRDDPGIGTFRIDVRVLGLAASVLGDVTGDGTVGIDDVVAVVLAWGPCGGTCPADLDGNGVIDIDDMVLVITNWSPGA